MSAVARLSQSDHLDRLLAGFEQAPSLVRQASVWVGRDEAVPPSSLADEALKTLARPIPKLWVNLRYCFVDFASPGSSFDVRNSNVEVQLQADGTPGTWSHQRSFEEIGVTSLLIRERSGSPSLGKRGRVE
jgi:hypothetical protein